MEEESSIKQNDVLAQDALDQSIALNKIALTMLESKRRGDLWLYIILLVSILVNVAIAVIFISYESQFTTEKTVTTVVEQDTGDGNGNNIYQAGEQARYFEGNEVLTYGEANSPDNYNSNTD